MTKIHLYIGVGVLTIIGIVVLAALVSGGDPIITGSIGAAATAAAAEAARRRAATHKSLGESTQKTKDTASKIDEIVREAEHAMDEQEIEIGNMDPKTKAARLNKLLGGGDG